MKSTLNLEEIRRNFFDLADDSDSDNRDMTDILIEKESRYTCSLRLRRSRFF